MTTLSVLVYGHTISTPHTTPNFCVNLLKKESTAVIQEAKKDDCAYL